MQHVTGLTLCSLLCTGRRGLGVYFAVLLFTRRRADAYMDVLLYPFSSYFLCFRN